MVSRNAMLTGRMRGLVEIARREARASRVYGACDEYHHARVSLGISPLLPCLKA